MSRSSAQQRRQDDIYNEMVFHKHVWKAFGEEALLSAAVNLYRVPPSDTLTTNEQHAADAGAEKAGEYLMDIDKTDFAEMSEEERDEFVRQLILGYRAARRERIISDPPF